MIPTDYCHLVIMLNRSKMIFAFLLPTVIAFEFQKYQADYFFKESMFTPETVLKPALNAFSCAMFCKNANGDKCSSIVPDLAELEHCQAVDNTQSLIKTHQGSQNAVKMWSTAPINTVAHFMCFTELYKFNDYSLDSINSPIMTSKYPNFPSLRYPCGVFIESERKLAIKARTTAEIYEWIHGEPSVTQLTADKNDPVLNRAAAGCGYSASKFIMYSGGNSGELSAFIYDSGSTKTISTPHGRRYACTAFHPLDDNIVYVFGGYTPTGVIVDHAFAFYLNASDPQDIKSMPLASAYVGCIGFVKNDGKPAIFLAGGLKPGLVLDTTWVYDIQSDTYDENAPSLPLKRYAASIVEKGEYIYSFGGLGATTNVLRIKKSLDADWEELENLVAWSAWNYAVILPYN